MQNHFVRYCSVCILIFGLVACGGGGSSSATPSNDPPIANAGVAQNVTLGPVFLDGKAVTRNRRAAIVEDALRRMAIFG